MFWQVEARLRDQVFKDEVEWDLADPQNTAFSYANAVCCDLGLGWEFAAAITGAVEAQLTAKRQVRIAHVLFVLNVWMHACIKQICRPVCVLRNDVTRAGSAAER